MVFVVPGSPPVHPHFARVSMPTTRCSTARETLPSGTASSARDDIHPLMTEHGVSFPIAPWDFCGISPITHLTPTQALACGWMPPHASPLLITFSFCRSSPVCQDNLHPCLLRRQSPGSAGKPALGRNGALLHAWKKLNVAGVSRYNLFWGTPEKFWERYQNNALDAYIGQAFMSWEFKLLTSVFPSPLKDAGKIFSNHRFCLSGTDRH